MSNILKCVHVRVVKEERLSAPARRDVTKRWARIWKYKAPIMKFRFLHSLSLSLLLPLWCHAMTAVIIAPHAATANEWVFH